MCRGIGYHCDDVETEEGLPTLHIDARDYPMAEAIQRVRELHIPKPCWCCEDVLCANCNETYPCSTIKALDGEQ